MREVPGHNITVNYCGIRTDLVKVLFDNGNGSVDLRRKGIAYSRTCAWESIDDSIFREDQPCPWR